MHDASSGGMRTLASARVLVSARRGGMRTLASARVLVGAIGLGLGACDALASARVLVSALVSAIVSAIGLGLGACAALAGGYGNRGQGGGRRLEQRRLGGICDLPEILPEICSCLWRLGGVCDRHGQPGSACAGVGHIGLHQ